MRRAASAGARARPLREPKINMPPGAEVPLQLASLIEAPPRGEEWVYETKYDGYRLLARVERGRVELSTRQGKDFTARAPSVVEALQQLKVAALLDGELVSPVFARARSRALRPSAKAAGTATRAGGAGDFQALQNALRDGRGALLVYYAFDLLFCDGRDLRGLPLCERKRALAALLSHVHDPHLLLSEHLQGDGASIFREACKLGMEGVIAKRGDRAYEAGRSKSWLKLKCTGREEFVVVGYTPPAGARRHFGALLLATREAKQLRYAGKVGTGFSQVSLAELAQRLRPLARRSSPLSPVPRGAEFRGAHWVEPKLVVEIQFTERTSDGRLRHPSFQGVRQDKAASEVRRERPLR